MLLLHQHTGSCSGRGLWRVEAPPGECTLVGVGVGSPPFFFFRVRRHSDMQIHSSLMREELSTKSICHIALFVMYLFHRKLHLKQKTQHRSCKNTDSTLPFVWGKGGIVQQQAGGGPRGVEGPAVPLMSPAPLPPSFFPNPAGRPSSPPTVSAPVHEAARLNIGARTVATLPVTQILRTLHHPPPRFTRGGGLCSRGGGLGEGTALGRQRPPLGVWGGERT